jgi:hypothetical protein
MFGNNREDIRRFYQSTWQKHQAGTALQGLELLVAQVIRQHPEYHKLITQDTALAQDFSPEDGQTNPFLHMGMHITLAEQLGSDRPDIHQAEHQMMECLGLVLWEAQKQNRTPDEKNYLACLRKLI